MHSDKDDFNAFLPSFRAQKSVSDSYQGNLSSVVAPAAASSSGYQDNLNSPMPQRRAGSKKVL
jgi:hypothetical protein